jgi:hypothetical protein
MSAKTHVARTITLVRAASVLLVLGASVASPQAPGPLRNSRPLKAIIADPAARDWAAESATVDDNFQQVRALIRMKNISGRSIRDAKFYAEFFDSHQRRCFTLPFDLDFNREHLGTPLAPGATRTLASGSNGLGFAVEPVIVKVYLVEQQDVNGLRATGGGAPGFRIPLTVPGGIPPNWGSLRLDPQIVDHMHAVEDLVLGEVVVDEAGKLKRAHVIQAADEQLRAWFTDAISKLYFVPAGSAGVPVESHSLILVRAFDHDAPDFYASAFLPRDSQWMRKFTSDFGGPDIPVVNGALFEPAGTWTGDRVLDRGLFEYGWVGSDWSAAIYTWLSLGGGRCCRSGWKTAADH